MAMASTFTVDSVGDVSDWNIGDGICDDGSGYCTLRAAIEEANTLAGADTIHFNISAGPNTIQPSTPLPNITSPVIIDGYTEPGALESTADVPATLMVELGGTDAGYGVSGLILDAGSDSTIIMGLIVNNFEAWGIQITGSNGNTISGNYIGTDVTGTYDFGNSLEGVEISNASSNNTIGGTTSAERNIISGNGGDAGVTIEDYGSTGNTVSGNYIGTDVTGTLALGNHNCGVRIQNGASDNTVGGTSAEERNIISYNGHDGIYISGSGTTDNIVIGNYIGTDVTGTYALENIYDGIAINNKASYNRIGGTTAGEHNIISGNNDAGIVIDDSYNNTVIGNYIGTDISGSFLLGNGVSGVSILSSAFGNIIGGTFGTTPGGPCTGACNVISGNGGAGVHMQSDVSDNIVQGNYIGTDVTGTIALGNISGVFMLIAAFNNVIGGSSQDEGNIISGNDFSGVTINDPGSTGNIIQGNYIGTDVTGTVALGNGAHGVEVNESPGNTIGGSMAGVDNIISGNGWDGIGIGGTDATGNLVQGNYIGTDVTGTIVLPNNGNGVGLGNCNNNTIIYNHIYYNIHNGLYMNGSSETTLTQNIISSNSGYGISCGEQSNMTITNSTVTDNVSGGILAVRQSSFTIINSILWNNGFNYEVELYGSDWPESTISYSNVQGGWDSVYSDPESSPPMWGEGMIEMDPLFVNPAGDDYHLNPNSPCIDAGIDMGVYADIDGDVIPQGCGFDIGADENSTCHDCDGDHFTDDDCGGTDCDDSNSEVNPGMQGQDCTSPGDGIDNDCDEQIDEDECSCFIYVVM